MTIDRVEPTLFDDAADFAVDEREARRDRFQVDALDSIEDGAAPIGASEPRARRRTPASGARGSTKHTRLKEDILRGSRFYDAHGQHNAAARAREIAAGLDTL